MTAPEWEPFGLDDEERAAYQVLVPGVPPLMREPVLDWISSQLHEDPTYYREWSRRARCLDVQNATRVSLGVTAGGSSMVSAEVPRQALRSAPDMAVLRVTDYLLSQLNEGSAAVRTLERILLSGRSKWTVGERAGKLGLVERVPSGVQDAVEATIATGGAAGALLGRAWADAHGVEPKDSSAYALAVRAVETSAVAVVVPSKQDATLGNVIGQMKADGDWRLPFREHPTAPSAEVVLAMLRTLWAGPSRPTWQRRLLGCNARGSPCGGRPRRHSRRMVHLRGSPTTVVMVRVASRSSPCAVLRDTPGDTPDSPQHREGW